MERVPRHPCELNEAAPPFGLALAVQRFGQIPNPIFRIHAEQAVLQRDGFAEFGIARRQLRQRDLRPDEVRAGEGVRLARLFEEVGEHEPGQIVGRVRGDGFQKGEVFVHQGSKSATLMGDAGAARGARLSVSARVCFVR